MASVPQKQLLRKIDDAAPFCSTLIPTPI